MLIQPAERHYSPSRPEVAIHHTLGGKVDRPLDPYAGRDGKKNNAAAPPKVTSPAERPIHLGACDCIARDFA